VERNAERRMVASARCFLQGVPNRFLVLTAYGSVDHSHRKPAVCLVADVDVDNSGRLPAVEFRAERTCPDPFVEILPAARNRSVLIELPPSFFIAGIACQCDFFAAG
jgi:hypothetical protein